MKVNCYNCHGKNTSCNFCGGKGLIELSEPPYRLGFCYVQLQDLQWRDKIVYRLANHIKQMGQVTEILINKQGRVIHGYARCTALKALGITVAKAYVYDLEEDEILMYRRELS